MLCVPILIELCTCNDELSEKLPPEDHNLLAPLIKQRKVITCIVSLHDCHRSLLLMLLLIWDGDNFLWFDVKVSDDHPL